MDEQRPRWSAVLEPDLLGRHSWSIVSAFLSLSCQGNIELRLRTVDPHPRGEPGPTLLMSVDDRDSGANWRVCLDLTDFQRLASTHRSSLADITFKRSFSDRKNYEASNVRPLGLTLPHRAVCDRYLSTYALRSSLRSMSRGRHLRRSLQQIQVPFLLGLEKIRGRTPSRLRPPVSLFESETESPPTKPLILFQVRAWMPGEGVDPEDRKSINQRRAEVIRHLRTEFGSQFVGGFVPTPFAKREFPDCITALPTTVFAYANLVRRCSIAVSTVGLHGSNPWKLAEYLAAGSAIVTEPLQCRVPVPLEEGRNVLTFHSPEGCLEACRTLLSDEALRHSMRNNNLEYYRNEVRPDRLLLNRLRDLRWPEGGQVHLDT